MKVYSGKDGEMEGKSQTSVRSHDFCVLLTLSVVLLVLAVIYSLLSSTVKMYNYVES